MTVVQKLEAYYPLAGPPSVSSISSVRCVQHKVNKSVIGQVLVADGQMVLRLVGWKKGAKEMSNKWKECDESVWDSFDEITPTELWTLETIAMQQAHEH